VARETGAPSAAHLPPHRVETLNRLQRLDEVSLDEIEPLLVVVEPVEHVEPDLFDDG
jgi:hypothetical protein